MSRVSCPSLSETPSPFHHSAPRSSPETTWRPDSTPLTTAQKRQQLPSNGTSVFLQSVAGASTTLNEGSSTGSRLESPGDSILRPSLRQYRKDKASANHFFREPGPDFVVGIDFGTTFTTVAFVKPKVNRNEIITIENFSADPEPSRVGRQVPTECWYPLTPRSPFEEDTREEEIESYIENVPRMTEFDESIFQSTIDCPADDKNPICEGYLHGYEVAPYLNLLSAPGKGDQDGVHLTWMKLMLDRTDHTKDIRSELDQKLDLLKRVNRIRTNSDVIRDFFIVTIRHTIRELERHHGFTSESEVEVVISVPVCWAATSNFIMSKAVNEAMWRTGFGVSTDSASLNLFIVNEAEAAATSCLRAQQHNLRRNETFILLDCGGGTVDTGTYTIGREDPLRLHQQVFQPEGALCGSSYLNDAMRKFAMSQLKDETVLEIYRGIPLATIIERDVITPFEHIVKRGVDFERRNQKFRFRIDGLNESPTNPRLKDNILTLTYHDMISIFQPSLIAIDKLMKKQIIGTLNKNLEVDKVVLVGGFGDSPALRKFLMHGVAEINNKYTTSIQLVMAPPNMSATSVAAGAVLRALDKIGGPQRMPVMSIGVRRDIPFEDETIEQSEYAPLLKAKRVIDKYTHLEYVTNTITWIIKVGTGPVSSVFRNHFISEVFFGRNREHWIYREALYASDVCNEDHYKRSHRKNRGKTIFIGYIEVNLNHLKSYIPLKKPADRKDGISRYEVRVRVDYEIIDRDMKFIVRWPAEEGGDVIAGSQKTVSLAAVFEPGTM